LAGRYCSYFQEVDQHIEKLKEKFGSFVYASNITFLNPKDMEGQVKKMLPNVSVSLQT